MNKFLTPNGGLPIFGDDFQFLDAASRDAIKGILHEVAVQYSGNMILGGCELTVAGPTVTVAAGYLMIDYEVCKFDGLSFPVSTATTGVFALSSTNDTAGNRTMANATTTTPWQVRKAVFNPGALADGPLDYPVLKRTKDGIYNLLSGLMTVSTNFSMLASWSKPLTNPATLYRHFRQVSLVGDLVPGTIATNTWTKIATLPIGFRPVQRLKSVAYGSNSSGVNGVVFFEVFPNGELFAQASSATLFDLVGLNVCFVGA